MTVVASTSSPVWNFANYSGAPLVGGQLFSYQAGTTTPAPTWVDSTGTQQNTNPILLNAHGDTSNAASGASCGVWIPQFTAYKFVLEDPLGNTIWTLDNYFAPVAGPPYPQNAVETALGVTVVNFSYPVGYVDRYGNNASPGVTDMTVAAQAAISVIAASGAPVGPVVFLRSTYLITATLVVPNSVIVQGAGGSGGAPGLAAGTNIYINSNITAFTLGGNLASLSYFPGLRDLAITYGPASGGNSSIAIRVLACVGAVISNIFAATATASVSFIGVSFEGGSGAGCFGNSLIGCYLFNTHIGVQFTNNGTPSTNQTITGVNILGNSADAACVAYKWVNAADGQNTTITGGFVQTYNIAYQFSGQSDITITGVYLNGATQGSPKYDVFWSGSLASPGEQNVLIIGRQDQGFGLTGNFTNNAIPNGNGWITAEGINNTHLGVGVNDGSSCGLGGGTGFAPLFNATTAPLHATAIGSGALAALQTGTDNTAVGRNALNTITTTNANTAVGSSALSNASNTGASNVAMGNSAGSNNTTGGSNTSLGTGAQAGSTGSDNTAVGSGAIIGTVAGVATSSNQFLLGDASVATLYCKQTTITTTSDQRDKTDIADLKHGLAFIMDLIPVEWTWAHREPNALDGMKEQGFVAQHCQGVVDKHGAHSLRLVDEGNPDLLGVAPGKVLMPAVVAIQELAARLAALEAKVK